MDYDGIVTMVVMRVIVVLMVVMTMIVITTIVHTDGSGTDCMIDGSDESDSNLCILMYRVVFKFLL